MSRTLHQPGKHDRPTRTDQGQILMAVALMMVILIAMVGLALDVGRIFIMKAELSRAVDAAALAGSLDLPDAAQTRARVSEYMAENKPSASSSVVLNAAARQLRVSASEDVKMIFLALLGFDKVSVDATAVAGFGAFPLDVYLAIDATGSMGASPCNSSDSNPGCPIKEAKDAAMAFADTLLGDSIGSGYAQVGAGAFRGCYEPPRNYSVCVDASGPDSMVTDLTSSKATLNSGIANIGARGGTGTNICLGMHKGEQILFGANGQTAGNTLRYIVILTDGDNTYNQNSYGQGQPPNDCRPNASPWSSDGYVGSSCRPAQMRERQLDVKTMAIAERLKSQAVEIYVVSFGTCGSADSSLCKPNMIGRPSHDNAADRNLLKCIASSSLSTNDHYFEVPTASDLSAVFTSIAQQIAHRLIE